LEAEKGKVVTNIHNPKVTENWRFTDEALSPVWLRLIRKLSESRKKKPVDAPQDAGDGEMKGGKDGNLQNL